MITPTPLERDIILTCKGWYPSDKYPNRIEALKPIAEKYYGCSGIDIIEHMITEVFDKFVKLPTSTIINEAFKYASFDHRNSITKSDIIDRYISNIQCLRIKDVVKGETYIDLDTNRETYIHGFDYDGTC